MEEIELKNAIKRAAKKLSKQAGGYGPVLEFTLKNGPDAPFSISYRFDEHDNEYDREKADKCLSAFAHILHSEITKKEVADGLQN